MKPGDALPALSLATTSGEIRLPDTFRGQWLVLYFYPKDATPGCTQEGRDFREHAHAFTEAGAVILGVSRDSLKSHEKFRTCESFPFELVSDTDETLCQMFDVIRDKSMYGKTVRGIERSTFLIDPEGIVRHAWRKVRVPQHVEAVLQTLRQLQSA